MGIELVRDLKTVRTNPRIMKHTVTDTYIMTLHDHEATSGLVYLNGPNGGKVIKDPGINWDAFEDLKGSVTLWNRD